MIQIDQYDLDKLFQHQKELNALFENIVIQYVKEYLKLNPELRFEFFDKKDDISDFVNYKIIENNIIFNGETPHVWFNSQGTGGMLYWSTKDSKIVPLVSELIYNHNKIYP